MPDTIEGLVALLQDAKYFEDAALIALRPLLRTTEAAIAASAHGRSQARALRAVLHVRPNGAYERVFVLPGDEIDAEPADISGAGAGDTGDFLASATAWRVVVEHRAAACFDVERQSADLVTAQGFERIKGPVLNRNPKGSRARFLGRSATHVCVLPLLAPGGSVEGMISIEVECLSAVGQPFLWSSCIDALRPVAQLCAPYLAALPLRATTSPKTDELLPVAGRTMKGMLPMLRVFATYDETLLITGPTGAGKSRIARWCHAQSNRKGKPFEVLDLTTIPENLQMAHLYGWRKGAFTGADKDVPGYLENAKGGTLFIDEIDKLSLGAQAGLLQLLDSRKYRVLGEKEDRQADVRFVIGTNADLLAAVEKELFRKDLYYRINVLPVRMLPLAQRGDEIPQWARYMLRSCHEERGAEGPATLAPEAESRLGAYGWPGNLRQLDNIVRRSYMLALTELGGQAQSVTVTESHVAQALAFEAHLHRGQLKESLLIAATVFVRLAERGGGLDLDLCDAFRGFVLGTALQTFPKEQAWTLLGSEKVLRHRNDKTRLRTEMERVDQLLRAVDELPSPFGAVHERGELEG